MYLSLSPPPGGTSPVTYNLGFGKCFLVISKGLETSKNENGKYLVGDVQVLNTIRQPETKSLKLQIVLTPNFLLPLHFIVQIFCLMEKVIHFAPLFISLSCIKYTTFGFSSEEFTNIGDREDYLFHGSIMTDNL